MRRICFFFKINRTYVLTVWPPEHKSTFVSKMRAGEREKILQNTTLYCVDVIINNFHILIIIIIIINIIRIITVIDVINIIIVDIVITNTIITILIIFYELSCSDTVRRICDNCIVRACPRAILKT